MSLRIFAPTRITIIIRTVSGWMRAQMKSRTSRLKKPMFRRACARPSVSWMITSTYSTQRSKHRAKRNPGEEKAGAGNPQPPVSQPLTEPATPRAARYSETRTNNLERLVDSYRQAKAELSLDDFKLLKLRIPGQGEVALRSYFRHIKFAKSGDNGRVLFGGGLIEQRYGQGFKFKFFDRLDGKLVTLYVSPAQMQAYRSSRYISELLSHADEVKFFTVYALGTVTQSPSGKSYSVEVDDLRHLAIVLGPAKELVEEGKAAGGE